MDLRLSFPRFQLPRSLGVARLIMICLPLFVPMAMATAQDEGPPELMAIPYDTIYLKNGNYDMGTIEMVSGGYTLTKGPGVSATYRTNEVQSIKSAQTVAQVIKKFGNFYIRLGNADGPDYIIKDYEFAMKNEPKETDHEQLEHVKEAVDSIARKAMEKWPNSLDLASNVMLPLLEEEKDTKGIEELARRLVEFDHNWKEGYEAVAKVLESDPARQDELVHWLQDQWLVNRPTDFKPNHDLALIHEKSENLRQAQEEYRKCFVYGKDNESGIGYARTSLERGQAKEALDAATALFDTKVGDEAKAIAGAADLALNDLPGAQTQLSAALAGTLSDPSAQQARYNLGLVSLRSGDLAKARDAWTQLAGTANIDPGILAVTKLALAILGHTSIDATLSDKLPSSALKEVAKQLNACVDLEHGRSGAAIVLDPGLSKRNQFLTTLAKLVNVVNVDTIEHELQQTPGIESLRWQIYGLLLQKQYEKAEALLDTLPPDDAYALAYHVCIADATQKAEQAKAYFLKAQAASNPPADWIAKVAIFYEDKADASIDEHFGWADGDVLHEPWQPSAPATGIHIHVAAGHLLLEGTQSASPDPVTSVFIMEPENRVHVVQVDLDISGLDQASAGIYILDEPRQNGVAAAVRGDLSLAWRALNAGVWGPWQPLGKRVQGTSVTLCLDYRFGKVSFFQPEDLPTKIPLAAGLTKPTANLSIGIFGTADPGVTWKIIPNELKIQLRAKGDSNRFVPR